jgi:hypothetical protein
MTEEDFLKADYQMNCSADLWNAPYGETEKQKRERSRILKNE